jgi:hypothetical protein
MPLTSRVGSWPPTIRVPLGFRTRAIDGIGKSGMSFTYPMCGLVAASLFAWAQTTGLRDLPLSAGSTAAAEF